MRFLSVWGTVQKKKKIYIREIDKQIIFYMTSHQYHPPPPHPPPEPPTRGNHPCISLFLCKTGAGGGMGERGKGAPRPCWGDGATPSKIISPIVFLWARSRLRSWRDPFGLHFPSVQPSQPRHTPPRPTPAPHYLPRKVTSYRARVVDQSVCICYD